MMFKANPGYMETLACVITLIISSLPLTGSAFHYEDIVSEDLGHSRVSNGSLIWGSLPKGLYHGLTRDAPSRGWELTIAFSRAVINSIQQEPFPSEIIRKMIKGQDTDREVEQYVVSVIVACFTGGLLIVFILICMVVFLRHEFRRRKKDVYLLKKPYMRDKPFMGFVLSSYIGTALSLIYVICLTVVSTNLHYGINVISDTVTFALDDVTTYFDTTKKQYNFVTSETNRWFNNEVIGGDMYRIGEILWQPGRDKFRTNIQPVFSSLSDLADRTNNAANKLTLMHGQLQNITTGFGGTLAATMEQIHLDLDTTRKDWTCIGCDGNCSGCKNVVVNDIFYQVDFSKLPSITSNVEKLNDLASSPFRETMQNPEYYYDKGLAAVITSRVAGAVSELNATITSYSERIAASTADLIFPSEKDMFFPTFRENFKSFDKRLVVTDTARYGFTWVFVFVNVVGCLVVFLALTLTVKGKQEGRRGGNPNYYPPYLLFMGAIGGCIALSLVFMSLSMMSFYGGVNLEKGVCQPGKSLQYLEKVLDVPNTVKNHPGYFVSSIILGNGSYTLRSKDIYKSCQQRWGAYSVLHHHLLVPTIFTDMNFQQPFQNINSSFDKMYVDLSSTSLVSSEFETWIDEFKSAAIFDIPAYEKMLEADVVKADVPAYIDNLLKIHSTPLDQKGPMTPAKERLKEIADRLNSVKQQLDEMSSMKGSIQAAFRAYQSEIQHIQDVVKNAVLKLRSYDSLLVGASSDFIREGVDQYKPEFIATVSKFSNQSQQWIHELGMCKPLSLAHDAVVYGFCEMIADFENAAWMLLGNNTVTLLFLLFVLSVVLYYLPDDDSDDTTDEFESIFGNGPPKGLINKAIYKVKCVFVKRRPSRNSSRNKGSSMDSSASNADPLLKSGAEILEMKNLPNGNVVNSSRSDKEPSPLSDAVASPRNQATDSTISLGGSLSSPTPSFDTDTKSGTSRASASTNKSRGIINHGSDLPTTVASRPGSVVISEVHPRPRGVDLSPNIPPSVTSVTNSQTSTPSGTNSLLVTNIDL